MFVYASYEGRLLRRRGAETGKLDSILLVRSFQLKAFLDVINDTLVTKPYLSVGNFIILASWQVVFLISRNRAIGQNNTKFSSCSKSSINRFRFLWYHQWKILGILKRRSYTRFTRLEAYESRGEGSTVFGSLTTFSIARGVLSKRSSHWFYGQLHVHD